jgi:iron-sulfur cluster repair protein YtfE (RIC family)
MSLDNTTGSLDLRWTVNDVVQRYPAALPIFNSLGIDTCCGGALPLATVAEKHHIGLDVLRSALERAIRGGGAA